jgi:hypothetical protein
LLFYRSDNVHNTLLSDEAVKAADLAYDKARMTGKMNQFRDTKKSGQNSYAKKEEKKMTLYLQMDAHKMKLSHILQLKDLFRSFAGPSNIDLEIVNKNGRSSRILIYAPWGIEWNAQMEKALAAFPLLKSECK